MGYTPVEKRNSAGANIPAKPVSVGGYVPVSSRASAPVPVVSPYGKDAVEGYLPVEKRPESFVPLQTVKTPEPVVEKPKGPGIVSKVSSAVAESINTPANKTTQPVLRADFNTLPPEEKKRANEEFQKANVEWAKKNSFSKQLPSSIMESLPFGLGAVFKQIHEEENEVKENPDYAPFSPLANFDNKDLMKNLPGATVEAAKGFVKAPISGAVNIYDTVANKKTKFNIPGLGEVSSAQYRTAERVANGENPVQVAIEEGSTAILDTLFFISLAAKPFQGRPVTTAKAEVPADFYAKTPGASKGIQPKSFRLYEPKTMARPLTPEFINRAQGQGIDFGPKFNPELPTYFKMSFKPKTNSFVGEIVQIKPSYARMLGNLFGKKADPGYTYTAKDLGTSGHDLDRAIESGDMPVQKVYKDKTGHLTPEYAQHVVSDLAGKLDNYKPGLGDTFKKSVKLNNPTPTNLDTQALAVLNNATSGGGANIPPVVAVSGLLNPAQISATPDAQLEVLHTKEVKADDIENASKNPIVVDTTPPNTTTPQERADALMDIPPKTTTPKAEVPMKPITFNEKGIADPVAEAKKFATAEEFIGSLRVGDPLVSKSYADLVKIHEQATGVTEKAIVKPSPEIVKKLEMELQNAFKKYPEAEDEMSKILTALELAQPGQRIFLDHDGTRDSNVIGVSSTFPAWIPEGLRTTKSLEALRGIIKDISSITYPARPNATGRRLLVDSMLDVLDDRLGVNTKAIRQDILKQYGKNQTNYSQNTYGSQPAGRGEPTGERAKIIEKKNSEKADQIERLKREIADGEDFGGKLSEQDIAERKSELAKLEGKTQKEKVEDAIKETPKSIKEIAEETKIKEPNVRRILGVGAKEGVFERVDKGVYILSKDGQDLAYVEVGDALESLPRLAGEGFKADMVFLDIPYDTPAIKGGNRGMNYNLISVEEFGNVLDATGKIVRDDKAPVIHMFSQAPSGMKAMEKYNNLFIEKGFKPVGRGQWQKLFANGKPVTNVRGEISKPEGILVFTKSGELKKDLKNLNFTLKRPKGYQSEKSAEMLKAMIEMTTEEGEIVLDPFAGSGVTGAEAIRAGRKTYLIEKDVDVAETITKPRVKEAVGEERKGKRIGLMDYDPSYTENMRRLIKEAQDNGDTFPYLKMSKTEQGILDTAWKKALSGFADDSNSLKGSNNADVGVFVEDTPVELGNMDKVRPIEFPELVDLARELSKNPPKIKKLPEHKGGFFKESDQSITLNADAFKNPEQAAKILAHEIGHLIDYLPEGTLARGNLLGRLKTLQGFMFETFGKEGDVEGPLSKERRNEIKNRVTKEVLNEKGLKFGDLFGNKLSKEGRQALNQEIRDKTKAETDKLLTQEGFIRNKVIQKELMDVSMFWRPLQKKEVVVDADNNIVFDEETGKPKYEIINIPLEKYPESFQKYRKSSKELYADAISVLFNTPGTLERMAPIFYKEFFNALDNKLEVSKAFFELQDILGGDRDLILNRRREGVRGMFDKGDMKAADIHKAKMAIRDAKRKNYALNFKFNVIDKNYPVIDRLNAMKKRGENISDDENPLYYLEERNYLGGKIKAFVEKNIQPIYEKLGENEISWTDFGEALFYDRIRAGDRSEQANPRGITPKAAEELLGKMFKEMGETKATILTDSMVDFRDALKMVAEEAFTEGLYKPEMHDTMMQNPAYATFQVLDHMEEGMTSKIHKSIGTLKDIANPADASILKTIATFRAIEQNKVKRSVVEWLEKSFPEDIKPANTINTPKGLIPQESKMTDERLVTYMKGGKRLGYYVDPYIKASVENGNIGDTMALLRLFIQPLATLNSTLFRPLFITYNPGFQAFNLLRDFQRFWKNTPTMTIVRAFSLYVKAMPAAKARAWGDISNATLQKMEEQQILSISYNQLADGAEIEDKQIDTILRNSGIETWKPEAGNPLLKPFIKVLDFIKNTGDFIETLPKVAGYLEMTKGETVELSREQKSFIRKNIGSPDFLAGGFAKPLTNEIFLFSNAIAQGIRSDVNVATDPKTRSGYWYKTVKVNMLPKVFMLLASLGFFGAAVKEIMDGASEYDKTNYTIIPLGFDENGKPVYFRMPQDETGRMVGGLVWKILNSTNNNQNIGKDLIDMASFTGGQIPSVTPSITSVVATSQYISGQNPYDWFRNREVLTDDQLKAGGMYSAKPFLGWLFNQSGGGIFYHFTQGAPREQSGTEKLFNLPLVGNIAGRFIKVSNYGETEKLNKIRDEVQGEQARRRIDENNIINDYIGEAQKSPDDKAIEKLVSENKSALVNEVLGHAPETKEELARANNIVKKYQIGLQRGESDPVINSLISAVTNEEKVELLTEIRASSTKQEYNALMLTLLKYKIVSPEVFIKVPNPAKKQ